MKQIILFFSILLLFSCKREDEKSTTPFNRKNILTHVADDMILPAYTKLETDHQALVEKINAFVASPNTNTLTESRNALSNAYVSWQKAYFYELGPAEDEKLKQFFNTYPTSPELLKQLALAQDFQLHLLSNKGKQGYPALDYLLYGFGNNEAEILAKYTTDEHATQYKNFLVALSNKLLEKTSTVKNTWLNGYRDQFVENDGSSTYASIDVLANAYLSNYEKFYKNTKLGTPLGESEADATPKAVESYYNPELSSKLFKTSTLAMKNFFEGKNYDGTGQGACFMTYLNDLDKEDVAQTILNNFDAILVANEQINGTYREAVINDRANFSNLYNKVEANRIPMKVDMLQAMNITVAYFDGDGD